MTGSVVNFGRNISFDAISLETPESEADVLELLKHNQGKQIRVFGSLHSWSEAAVTTGVAVSLANLNSVSISNDRKTAVVGAGCKMKSLLKQLASDELTLPSVGLIDEQTLAGATATGTHGSGKQCLSHFIVGATIAHYGPDGEAKLTRVTGGPELRAAMCSLGLLGIVTSITVRCRPRYNVEEHAKAHTTLDSVLAMQKKYPLQQFYLMPWSWTYFGHHRVESNAERSKLARLYRVYCFLVIDLALHVVTFLLAKIVRMRWAVRAFFKWILPLTIVRNWKVVDDSHSMLVMEHELFRHIEIEVFVRKSQLKPALTYLTDVISIFGKRPPSSQKVTERQLSGIGRWDELQSSRGAYCHHYPICVRRVMPDETLISMGSAHPDNKDEDWYAISLISYQWPSDRKGFTLFADFVGTTVAQLFGGRCHWGKYNPLDRADNETLYSGLSEFQRIAQRFDAQGAFCNKWLEQVLR